MKISTIMSGPVVAIAATDTIVTAADLMRRHAIGVLPVLEGWRPVGVLTDRDIVMRAVSGCRDTERRVGDVISPRAISCRADQTVAEAAAIMGNHQVRRLLVVDRAGHLVGMLSVGDIARDISEELAGQALGEIIELRKSAGRKA